MKKTQIIKKKLLRFWDFLANDDSFLSLATCMVLAFIFIKFMLYPGIGLILNTNHPIVAIVSGSMEHKLTYEGSPIPTICGKHNEEAGNLEVEDFWKLCGSWYENINISENDFNNFQYKNGLNIGDIIVLRNPGAENIIVGDIIVFIQPQNKKVEPIIHRVVKITPSENGPIFQTKGDHNKDSIKINNNAKYLNEYEITKDQLIGRATFRIPFVGYIKIWAYDFYIWILNLFQ